MATLKMTVEEYEFDGDLMTVELEVEYQCSPYYAATGPSFNSPGEPAEGGEIEEIEVTLLKASIDTAYFVGFLHGLIQNQITKQVDEGGDFLEKIEARIYEEPPPDDGDYWDE